MKFIPIPIFYYHSVAPSADSTWCNSFLTFALKYFEDMLRYLTLKGYHFITLDEYLELRRDPTSAKRRLICLTFDDGYLDNYVYIFPLLKKYRARGTIFISPLFIQDNPGLRPTLEDAWKGQIGEKEVSSLGFASWDELQAMQDSGIMDIQSHTMTHTKYVSSEKITDFHHPDKFPLYAIVNRFPERAPWYATDSEFFKLLPYGTPLFEEISALITRKNIVNEAFVDECTRALKDYSWQQYSFRTCFDSIADIYHRYLNDDSLFTYRESEEEYLMRIKHEIAESKRIIERRLNKPVNHVCWPHGDYNDLCHAAARASGYLSSHIVLKPGEENSYEDRFDRTGSSISRNNRALTLLKTRYKLGAYRRKAPWHQVSKAYSYIKYGNR